MLTKMPIQFKLNNKNHFYSPKHIFCNSLHKNNQCKKQSTKQDSFSKQNPLSDSNLNLQKLIKAHVQMDQNQFMQKMQVNNRKHQNIYLQSINNSKIKKNTSKFCLKIDEPIEPIKSKNINEQQQQLIKKVNQNTPKIQPIICFNDIATSVYQDAIRQKPLNNKSQVNQNLTLISDNKQTQQNQQQQHQLSQQYYLPEIPLKFSIQNLKSGNFWSHLNAEINKDNQHHKTPNIKSFPTHNYSSDIKDELSFYKQNGQIIINSNLNTPKNCTMKQMCEGPSTNKKGELWQSFIQQMQHQISINFNFNPSKAQFNIALNNAQYARQEVNQKHLLSIKNMNINQCNFNPRKYSTPIAITSYQQLLKSLKTKEITKIEMLKPKQKQIQMDKEVIAKKVGKKSLQPQLQQKGEEQNLLPTILKVRHTRQRSKSSQHQHAHVDNGFEPWNSKDYNDDYHEQQFDIYNN